MATDKIVLVTGGAEGIGLAIASGFARAGATAILADLDHDRAASAAADLVASGHRAIAVEIDVAAPESVARCFQAIKAQFGKLDTLVNNAGISGFGPAATLSTEQWGQVLAVNLSGTFLAAQHAFPLLVDAGGGSIVNIASVGARVSSPGFVAYSASKSGLIGLTRALAVEWAEHGIRVNSISPGSVDTALARASRARDPETFDRRVARVPLRRTATPDDIAEAALFLSGPGAAMITGQDLVIDGGITGLHPGYVR